jgi:hypothetical protein
LKYKEAQEAKKNYLEKVKEAEQRKRILSTRMQEIQLKQDQKAREEESN